MRRGREGEGRAAKRKLGLEGGERKKKSHIILLLIQERKKKEINFPPFFVALFFLSLERERVRNKGYIGPPVMDFLLPLLLLQAFFSEPVTRIHPPISGAATAPLPLMNVLHCKEGEKPSLCIWGGEEKREGEKSPPSRVTTILAENEARQEAIKPRFMRPPPPPPPPRVEC